MRQPITNLEIIRRLEAEIARRLDARESVLGRIERGDLHGTARMAVLRKAGRMAHRIQELQQQLEEVRK